MTERLPLFPLGTVLFPGLILPLHVFEERYQQLVGDLSALPPGTPRRFGVVAIRRGREVGSDGIESLYDVGCTAEVRRVDPLEDGRFDVVAVGSTRWRLRAVDATLPYLVGETEEIQEHAGGGEDELRELARQVGMLYARYRERVGATLENHPPPDARSLSWLVAATAVLALAEKQALLVAPDDATRLSQELELLRRELGLLRVLPSLPAVDLAAPSPPLN